MIAIASISPDPRFALEVRMKRLTSTAILCFLIGAPTFARQPQQQEQQQDERAKKKQEEERQRQAQEQQTDKKQQQEEKARPEDRSKQEKQQQQIEKQQQKQQEKQQKELEKQQRKEEQRNHGGQAARTTQQPTGGQTRHGSRVIPQEKFQAHFGREHHFHVAQRVGDRRFQYGGYWFEYVEVWPAEWSYDDDFYIDFFDDDYYLCDLEHPQIRLVVIVVE